MRPEETFHQLLGLGQSWKVIRTDYEAEQNTLVICVAETEALWAEESQQCGQAVSCYDHVEPMQWRHLNVFNKECVIVSALPRGRRKDDGVIYRVTPPWEGRSKHFTKEFEGFALTPAREMPVKKAGKILGETDQRLWRMLHAHVEAARARADWSEVVWVGGDEMNRKKGHNYVTVSADLMNKRVLFGTEGREANVWEAFADELRAHNGHPKAITQVAIDMSPAYIKGVT
jgi:transposase